MDGFVTTHFIGWWLKTLIIRDYWLCNVLSIGFELLEYSLQHQLPNFSECWWDHVIWILNMTYFEILMKFEDELYEILSGYWTFYCAMAWAFTSVWRHVNTSRWNHINGEACGIHRPSRARWSALSLSSVHTIGWSSTGDQLRAWRDFFSCSEWSVCFS